MPNGSRSSRSSNKQPHLKLVENKFERERKRKTEKEKEKKGESEQGRQRAEQAE